MNLSIEIRRPFLNIIFLFIFLNNVFAGLNYINYFDNNRFSEEYNTNGTRLFKNANDGCFVNIINNDLPDELKEIPTMFLLDSLWGRISWNIFKIHRAPIIDTITGIDATFRFLSEPLINPYDVEFYGNRLYISDEETNKIYIYTLNTSDDGVNIELYNILQDTYNGKKMESPKQIAVNSKNIYVADYGNDRILAFNNVGSFQNEILFAISSTDKLSYPLGVAIGKNDNIYVSDAGSKRIVRYDSSGNYLNSIKNMPADAWCGMLATCANNSVLFKKGTPLT